MPTVRPAAVAGAFYPGDPRALAAQLGELLASPAAGETGNAPKAVIVPHAGYIYSGAVAARAYQALAAARNSVTRVVLLGPVHRVPVRGLALPGADAFDTPLGRIAVDAGAVRALADLPQVVTSPAAHALEHSLEVQLPFLQKVLGSFSLVPLAVGDASVAEVAEVIERLWGGPETVFVLSTDMSHYHRYQDAKRIDGATLARIASLATDLNHQEACGATPLNGLLQVAREKGLSIRQLAACNSGDTAGDRARVVGYSSFALYESGAAESREEQGRTLLGIARGAIGSRLGQAAPPQVDHRAWLTRPGATFVTLTIDGALRGCIGSLQAHRALGLDVAANAENAAFRDPRFAPLSMQEWPQIEAEVSLLSTPEKAEFGHEIDLLGRLRPGVDGVILEHGGRRGTFLPQVWDSLPDRRQFMQELKRKAGLAPDTPLAQCQVWRYQVVKWREADFAD
jgi:MEMO1 family protein